MTASVIALAIVVAVTGRGAFESRNTYTAVFSLADDVQGIKPGDDVRLGGIRVGSVREVEVIDDVPEGKTPRVEVKIRVPARYRLRENANVSVGGLIGSAFMNIDSLGTGPMLAAGGEITGTSGGFGRVVARVDEVVKALQRETIPKINEAVEAYGALAVEAREKRLPELMATTDEARKLLGDIREQIKPVVERFIGVADAAKVAATNLGDFIGPGNDPASKDFKQTLANLKDTSATLKTEIPQVSEKLKSTLAQFESRLNELKGTTDDLRATMASARDVSAEVRSMLVDNRANIDRIIMSVESSANNAKAFTAEVLRRPSRLLWRDDQRTQDNLAIYHTARDFAEGAQELNDAAGSLRDALRDPRIPDAEVKRRLEQLQATFDRFGQVEEKLFKSVK